MLTYSWGGTTWQLFQRKRREEGPALMSGWSNREQKRSRIRVRKVNRLKLSVEGPVTELEVGRTIQQ
jgi:hypothetical protein